MYEVSFNEFTVSNTHFKVIYEFDKTFEFQVECESCVDLK